MAVLQGSYDDFLNALRAQAPQPQTPTGGAIDLRNRLFSPTPVPTPAPAPKPRADMGIDYTPTGTVAAPAAPAPVADPIAAGTTGDTSQLPWLQRAGLGVNNFLSRMGQAQIAADQPAIDAGRALSGAVGGGLSNLAAGLGGQTTPVMAVEPAKAPVVAPAPVGVGGGAKPALAASPAYTGFMDPRTHSLEEFVAANKDITMREALGIMKANPQGGAQGRIQQMLLGLAEAQHVREVQNAGADQALLNKADYDHSRRLLGIINPQGSLYYGIGSQP